VNENIKTWLLRQNVWLQEAAFRLLTNGGISDQDIIDFVSIIADPEVQINPEREYPELSADSATGSLKLVSVGDIVGIDNLSPRLPLNFGTGNLVVIYGSNGSGKSGYARILKKCSGKAGAVNLKSNVYCDPPAESKCTISYSINGGLENHTWIANSDPIPALRAIDIFDTTTGWFYLTKETEVAYSPPELAFFAGLVGICNKVSDVFDANESLLLSVLPASPPNLKATNAIKLYDSISTETLAVDYLSLLTWGEAEQKQLDDLQAKLANTEPLALARIKEGVRNQVDKIKSSLDGALTAISTEIQKSIPELHAKAIAARRSADDGALVIQQFSQLEGIPSESWRSLWEAARKYSLEEAYQEKDFPNTEAGSRCVLCHQGLDPEASDRLQKFEGHICSTLESDAKDASLAFSNALSALPVSPSEEELHTAFVAAGIPDELQSRIKLAWDRIEALVASIKGNPAQEHVCEFIDCSNELKEFSAALDAEIAQLNDQALTFDRNKAEAEVLELRASHWAFEQSAAIHAELARCSQVAKIRDWKKQTVATGISRKAGELSESLITAAYITRFNDELIKLGANRISVSLEKTRVLNGEVKHQIKLSGLRARQDDLSEILSEGEARIVSLAAFLANVTARNDDVPFIFDDPISSLDHDFEWNVAVRLSELAVSRQVIVLTHRLSLYGGFEDAAKKIGERFKNDHLIQLCIESFSGSSGNPVPEAIWQAKPKAGNNILINQYLLDAKRAWDAGDSVGYRVLAQHICTEFRKLLERTIEHDLINSVILRHRRSVTTDNKISHLAKITPADCAFLDRLMTKYSCYEHSQSNEVPVFLPDEPELRADLEGLKSWREEFSARAAS
jgi:energy-coupling factor transporter ATP-binding protein EcfA2